jgi:putative membrane protein
MGKATAKKKAVAKKKSVGTKTATGTTQPVTTHVVTAEQTIELGRPRTLMEYLGLAARGFAMGSADVVPGVSGGTIAFILGIYEELIMSIRAAARPPFWQALLRFRIPEALRAVNAGFLLAVGVGILVAILSLAQGLEWLLTNQPVLLWSFFFGLVVASVVTVSSRIKQWTPPLWLAMAIGAVGAYILVGLVPVETPNDWWFLILSGAVAICAMILPGISGAFVLVLLGKYQYVLGAVNDRDFVTVALVGIGAVVGLVSFAQVLGWLFKRFHDVTVAILIGLMIGSLRKIWPWKEVLASIPDSHGVPIPTQELNILPALTINGAFNMEILFALGLAAVGFVLVVVMERVANRHA